MSSIPSSSFQSYEAVATEALDDLMLQDCGLVRLGGGAVIPADDLRIVRVSRPSLLDRLFKAARTAMPLITARI